MADLLVTNVHSDLIKPNGPNSGEGHVFFFFSFAKARSVVILDTVFGIGLRYE